MDCHVHFRFCWRIAALLFQIISNINKKDSLDKDVRRYTRLITSYSIGIQELWSPLSSGTILYVHIYYSSRRVEVTIRVPPSLKIKIFFTVSHFCLKSLFSLRMNDLESKALAVCSCKIEFYTLNADPKYIGNIAFQEHVWKFDSRSY